MSLQTVEITQDDDIVTLRLNRPDAANAVDLQMARDLLTAAEHCATTPGVRAVVLTGKGKMFSGGGDVPPRTMSSMKSVGATTSTRPTSAFGVQNARRGPWWIVSPDTCVSRSAPHCRLRKSS